MTTIVRMSDDKLEHLVTPHFMHMSLENIAQSFIQKKPVIEVKEVVQIQFAGDKNFSPVHMVDEVYKSDGINEITYAERFADQYRAFLNGDAQLASGTPLEKLVDYGIRPADISLCRALKIYTIESLAALEGANLKASGAVVTNTLKPMAQRYLEDRASGSEAAREIAKLREELAALKAGSIVTQPEAKPEEIDAAVAEAEERERLRELIYAKTGNKPHHKIRLETLQDMLQEAGG